MGVRYIVETMPPALQAAFRAQFPNGKQTLNEPLPLSRLILFHNRVVERDSIRCIEDLMQHLGALTKEEGVALGVVSRLSNSYFDENQKIGFLHQVLQQRAIERVANHLEEGFIFPRGEEVVVSVLREVFPDLETAISVTDEFDTSRWLRWIYTGDKESLTHIESALKSLRPTSLSTLLASVGRTTGLRFRRFVLGQKVLMPRWAAVWNLLVFNDLARPKSHGRFWDSFAAHFQCRGAGSHRTASAGSMRVLSNRFLGGREIFGNTLDQQRKDIGSIQDTIVARAKTSSVHRAPDPVEEVTLLDRLYHLIHVSIVAGTSLDIPVSNGVFGSPKDFAGYLAWSATLRNSRAQI